jgi:hypothetical protein
MFFTPAVRQDSDDEVAPGGHHAGHVASPQLGGVLGEGGVADMVQGLDFAVVADELGELGRGGLLSGQAGDGVDRLGGGLASLAVGGRPLFWTAWQALARSGRAACAEGARHCEVHYQLGLPNTFDVG